MDEATRLRRIMERAAALLEAPGACERCRAVARTLRRSVAASRFLGEDCPIETTTQKEAGKC